MFPLHSHTFLGALLTTYHLPGIFLGTFFFGETVVITATVLAAHGYWSLTDVFVWSFAGTVTSDATWFLFGRHLHRLVPAPGGPASMRRRLLTRLDRLAGRRPFVALLFTKFLYGTRILVILYLAVKKLGFRTFVLFDSLGTVLWLAVLLPIAWTAGGTTTPLIPRFHEVGAVLLALLATIVLFRLFALWLGKKLAPK